MSLKDRFSANSNKNTLIDNELKKQVSLYSHPTEIITPLDSLGPLETLLTDDELNSIFVSGAKNVYIERKSRIHKSTSTFRDTIQLENLIKKNAKNIGATVDENNPYIKFNHREGINVSITLPPLSNTPCIFIKCYKDKHATLQILQEEQSISKEMAIFLDAMNTVKSNIIIAGEKSTLKTTLLSALAKKIPSNEREIVFDCEQEFTIQSPNCTSYNLGCIQNEDVKSEIINTMVLSNPDKIIINDDKGDILNNFILRAINGCRGIIGTIEATSPKEALEKLTYRLLNNKPYLNYEKAKELIYKSIDIVIFVKKDENLNRKVSNISQIEINEEGEFFLNDIFTLNPLSYHESNGVIPYFLKDIDLESMSINESIFNKDYKHTYYQNRTNDALEEFSKRSKNIDILKKFKKDLSPKNDEENPQEENEAQENTAQENNSDINNETYENL